VQRYLDSATTTTTAAAAYSTLRRLTRGGDSEPVRPDHYQTIRLQMGGDGGSLEGKLSGNGRTIQNVTRHVHRETPPTTKSSTAMAGPRPTAPKPLLSSRPPLVGAPAFSSPPANQQQQWRKESQARRCPLEAQRRGPPPRDAGDADGGGGGGGGGDSAAATSRSCSTTTKKILNKTTGIHSRENAPDSELALA
jgi:hypothetical protein